VVVPAGSEICVRPGDKVVSARDILARLSPDGD